MRPYKLQRENNISTAEPIPYSVDSPDRGIIRSRQGPGVKETSICRIHNSPDAGPASLRFFFNKHESPVLFEGDRRAKGHYL